MATHPTWDILCNASIQQRPDGLYYRGNPGWEGPFESLKEMFEEELGAQLYLHIKAFIETFPPRTD